MILLICFVNQCQCGWNVQIVKTSILINKTAYIIWALYYVVWQHETVTSFEHRKSVSIWVVYESFQKPYREPLIKTTMFFLCHAYISKFINLKGKSIQQWKFCHILKFFQTGVHFFVLLITKTDIWIHLRNWEFKGTSDYHSRKKNHSVEHKIKHFEEFWGTFDYHFFNQIRNLILLYVFLFNRTEIVQVCE